MSKLFRKTTKKFQSSNSQRMNWWSTHYAFPGGRARLPFRDCVYLHSSPIVRILCYSLSVFHLLSKITCTTVKHFLCCQPISWMSFRVHIYKYTYTYDSTSLSTWLKVLKDVSFILTSSKEWFLLFFIFQNCDKVVKTSKMENKLLHALATRWQSYFSNEETMNWSEAGSQSVAARESQDTNVLFYSANKAA